MQGNSDPIIIPREFKLRLEYDAASGKKHVTYLSDEHAPYINYGLHQMTESQKKDVNFDRMGYWQGIIIGVQSLHCGEIMYSWVAKIPANYPAQPPIIRFITKIALPCIDERGFINVNRIPHFRWEPTMNIADVLMAIRRAMADPAYTKISLPLANQEFFTEYPPNQVEKNFM